MKLILASASPRRKELLAQAGFDFTVEPRNADESFPSDMNPDEVAEYIANRKADPFSQDIGDRTILTADTVVIYDGEILGKPRDAQDAAVFLRKLSGSVHKVVTAVCIMNASKRTSFSSTSLVHFHTLSDEEIAFYIEKFQPFDKAGAYGIQEWIGLTKIAKIEGSYYNIVGLPVDRVYEELKRL